MYFILFLSKNSNALLSHFFSTSSVEHTIYMCAFLSGGNISAQGNITSTNVFTGIVSASGNITSTGYVDVTYNVSAAGNVIGGNILTGGLISATGNITSAANVSGGNLLTGGVVSSTGNLITGANVVATANVIGGNISTGGLITATGNVQAGNLRTAGLVTATGNVTGGNITTGGVVSATGNITGANVNTNAIVGTALTLTSTGVLNLNPTGNIALSANTWINNLATPVEDADAANKGYVDAVAQGLDIKASVGLATTSALAAYTYNNGTSGVGATITANANGALSIDGTVSSADERVLIKNETGGGAPYNGIYVVTQIGSAGTPFILTRAVDFNAPAEIPGAFTFVEYGTTNPDTGWVCTTNSPVTVGTTNIVFAQFSGAGSYTANTQAGISLTGSVFSALVDGVTTAIRAVYCSALPIVKW